MSALVLASASPRRREILETLRVPFDVAPSDVNEDPRPGESAGALAQRLAEDKALAVSRTMAERFVLGADTVVVVDGELLAKPIDDDDARRMIASLAGRWHEVVTGIALARDGALVESATVSARVHMIAMNRARIDRYVATGEGRDKAGAYAVQGIAMGLCDRIEGSHATIVGLPAAETIALLERHGALAEGWP